MFLRNIKPLVGWIKYVYHRYNDIALWESILCTGQFWTLFCVLKTLVAWKRSTVSGNIFIATMELIMYTTTLYTSKCHKSTGATEKVYARVLVLVC